MTQAGTCIMVELGGSKRFFFDFGPGCLRNIIANQVPVPEITDIFLTHLHIDHCGEIPYGWKVNRWTLSCDGRQLVSETRTREDERIVKKLLEREEDLDLLLTFPINNDPARIAAELDRRAAQYLAEKAEFPSDYGSMMLDLGEPISYLYHNSKLEEFALWSLMCSRKVQQFLDGAMENYRHIYRYCLERDWADVYFMVGSELASPPMVSRNTFRKWIVPYAKELIAIIHAHGKYAIQHYHGQIKLILEDFVEVAPDALHTIEAPPTGNCTWSEAYAVVKDRIALIGNVQYDLFRSCTPAEMREHVRQVIAEVRAIPGARLILSPSAGPYEQMISPRMTENYLAFPDAGVEFGK